MTAPTKCTMYSLKFTRGTCTPGRASTLFRMMPCALCCSHLVDTSGPVCTPYPTNTHKCDINYFQRQSVSILIVAVQYQCKMHIFFMLTLQSYKKYPEKVVFISRNASTRVQ